MGCAGLGNQGLESGLPAQPFLGRCISADGGEAALLPAQIGQIQLTDALGLQRLQHVQRLGEGGNRQEPVAKHSLLLPSSDNRNKQGKISRSRGDGRQPLLLHQVFSVTLGHTHIIGMVRFQEEILHPPVGAEALFLVVRNKPRIFTPVRRLVIGGAVEHLPCHPIVLAVYAGGRRIHLGIFRALLQYGEKSLAA
ncbi:hypothetical protein D3C75_565880 [compost metagenome]